VKKLCRKLKHVKVGFNFKIINKSMNANLVLQFTRKRRKKNSILVSKVYKYGH
jgi:hypothetical protein